MLDMGFLPEIRKILKHLPAKRQTLFFSATMPPPIVTLSAEMLHNPVTIAIERQVGAGRRHHAGGLSGVAGAEVGAAGGAAAARRHAAKRWSSRARSTARTGSRSIWSAQGINAERIHGNRSQAQRTAALAGFKSGTHPRARRDRHRGARHRRRGARARRELRRADGARGLHPPRRPHGARRGDRRRVHVRLAAGRGRPARHRAGDRQAAAARHRAGLRLHGAARSRSSRSRSPSASRRFAR